ncbi:hypothetical protein, partial [Xanthomonas campestris]
MNTADAGAVVSEDISDARMILPMSLRVHAASSVDHSLYQLSRTLQPSLVAPEKPPITQRPQGLDVCSGVP